MSSLAHSASLIRLNRVSHDLATRFLCDNAGLEWLIFHSSSGSFRNYDDFQEGTLAEIFTNYANRQKLTVLILGRNAFVYGETHSSEAYDEIEAHYLPIMERV